MNKILGILFLLFSNHILAADYQDTCISTNCDVYREEKAKFLALLKEIKCTSQTDTSKDCDQIALSKLSADFSKRMAVLFNSPNVGATIKNDIQFNSLTNTFAEKKQNAPGYYELVPVLANPNIGVHWGGVQNNQAIVDRIVDIDPASPSVQNSNWYLTQWKKDTPLMLSSTRSDPISSNGPSSDSYLGKSKFEINAPVGKFGVETSLLIFKNPADNSNVFEIVGRNGWLDEAGGSNVFLSSDLMDNDHSHFDFDINLTFNGKISKMKSKYNDNSSETKGEVVVGQAFAAFTALYTPPNGGDSTSVFIQLLFGDTRGENFLYTGCYMLGSGSQIVYTHNLDNDFAASADSASAPLKPKKYNLNKYLCNALSQKFSCPSTIKKPDFSTMSKNLKNWKMTGFYTGVETQVAKASSADKSIPGPTKGQMEMGLQYSNMRVNANSNLQALDCATVLNRPEVSDPVVVPAPVVVTAPVEAGSCSKGSFKDGAGKTIDFYCGCGVVAGASKAADGCYHKLSDGTPPMVSTPAPVTDNGSCTKGKFTDGSGQIIDFSCGCGVVAGASKAADGCYHKVSSDKAPPVVTTPASPVDPVTCSRGNFTDGAGNTIEFACGCGVVAGAVKQADGCYHSTAKKPVEVTNMTSGSFCNGVTKTNWVCNGGDQGAGWKDAGKGCYHQATDKACD